MDYNQRIKEEFHLFKERKGLNSCLRWCYNERLQEGEPLCLTVVPPQDTEEELP
jgi:hypothetical protein